MKRAILIAVTLLLMFGVSAVIYSAYNHNEIELEYDEMENKEKSLTSGRYFEAKFKSKVDYKKITGIKHEIKDGILHITVLATSGEREPLPTDSDGFVTFNVDAGQVVEKVYYQYGEDKLSLKFDKK